MPLISSKKKLATEISNLFRDLSAGHEKINGLTRLIREEQNEYLEHVVTSTHHQHDLNRARMDQYLSEAVEDAQATILQTLATGQLELAPWHLPQWGHLTLPDKVNPPEFLRIGELIPQHLEAQMPNAPALLPLINAGHVFTVFNHTYAQDASDLLSNIVWRIAAFSSPTRYRLTLIDSIDLGRSFASLLNLPEVQRGSKILCQGPEIQETLQQLVDTTTDINQKRLLDSYTTIGEYNAANPHIAVPYHFVVFTGFPDGFTDQSIDLLLTLARTGPRAGLYLIGGLYAEQQRTKQTRHDELLEFGSLIRLAGSRTARWSDPLFSHMPLTLDPLPPRDLTELISLLVHEELQSSTDIVEFARFAPRTDDWWTAQSIDGIRIPLGLDESGKTFYFSLGPQSAAYHTLVGGRIGSGKTNFLHTLILGLTTTYPPEELDLYLVDFKEGVEFQDYANIHLPQARAIVIEAEREFGLSVLEYMDAEMERRSALFKTVDVNVVNLEEYRSRSGKSLPRIIAIFDEFVRLFEFDDTISDQAFAGMLRLAQRGRAFGIHLILAAQRPVGSFQNLNPVKSQISVRVAFKCNEPDDSILILGESNDKAAYIERTGTACVTYDPNLPSYTQTVKIAFVSQEDRTLYLQGIQAKVDAERVQGLYQPRVFSKWEPAFWHENQQIQQHLSEKPTATDVGRTFWIGQPIALAKDRKVFLERKENEHLLVLGSNELAYSLIINSLLGLFLTTPPNLAEFVFIEASSASAFISQDHLSLLKSLPHSFETFAGQEAVDILEELCTRMERRVAQPGNEPAIFLVIPGLHRIQQYRSSEAYTASPSGEALLKLLQFGPLVGIHTLAWVDRTNTLHNITGSMGTLDYFTYRIAMHMTSDESNAYLGIASASHLGSDPKRIYFRNQAMPEHSLEKIKPYEMPELSHLKSIVSRIKSRWEILD